MSPFIRFSIKTNINGLSQLVTDGIETIGILIPVSIAVLDGDMFNTLTELECVNFGDKSPDTVTSFRIGFPFTFYEHPMDKLEDVDIIPPYIKYLGRCYNHFLRYATFILKSQNAQRDTFINWMNEVFELTGDKIEDVKIEHFVATAMWLASIDHCSDHYTHTALAHKHNVPYWATNEYNPELKNPWTNKTLIIADNFNRLALRSPIERDPNCKNYTIDGIIVPP